MAGGAHGLSGSSDAATCPRLLRLPATAPTARRTTRPAFRKDPRWPFGCGSPLPGYDCCCSRCRRCCCSRADVRGVRAAPLSPVRRRAGTAPPRCRPLTERRFTVVVACSRGLLAARLRAVCRTECTWTCWSGSLGGGVDDDARDAVTAVVLPERARVSDGQLVTTWDDLARACDAGARVRSGLASARRGAITWTTAPAGAAIAACCLHARSRTFHASQPCASGLYFWGGWACSAPSGDLRRCVAWLPASKDNDQRGVCTTGSVPGTVMIIVLEAIAILILASIDNTHTSTGTLYKSVPYCSRWPQLQTETET